MDKSRALSVVLFCGLFSTSALTAAGQDFTGQPILKAGTYNVSETFTALSPDFGPFQASFTGRFTFNPNGTGLCSRLLCAPGVIPDFANVKMSGTATNITPWGPNIHGQIALIESGNTLDFVNFNGFSVPTSSESDLVLALTSPLGGSVTNIATSEADYNIFGGGSLNHGLVRCGAVEADNNATCSGSVVRVGHMGPKTAAVIRFADSSVGVPEPATFALFAFALAGLGIFRTRRVRREAT